MEKLITYLTLGIFMLVEEADGNSSCKVSRAVVIQVVFDATNITIMSITCNEGIRATCDGA